MTDEAWCAGFAGELRKLQAGLGAADARALALTLVRWNNGLEPRTAAQQYHARTAARKTRRDGGVEEPG